MFDWLRAIIKNAFNPNRTSTVRNPAAWFLDALGASTSDSGVRVDGRAILSYAPMWYAINRISGHVGILPLNLCQAMPDGDVRIADPREFPVINLVNRQPNQYMTGVDLRETVQSHAIVHGNGRSAVLRNGLGQPMELLPLQPETTQTYLLYRDGEVVEKWHHTTTPDGRQIPIPDRDVLHIKGLAADGLVGYSLVSIAKDSIGGALAAEKYVNRSYKNNAMPSIILEAPSGAFRNDQHAADFLAAFHANHGGLDNVARPGLLRYGVTARPISQNNTDAQFLENRRFSREEAALWTSIESMLGVEKAESYNTLAQRNEAYRQNCLSRWLKKWEQELDAKLLSARQLAAGYYWKFDTYQLLSGSIKERWETLEIGRRIGLVSQEESRRRENLGRMNPNENFDNPNTTAGGEAEPAEPPEPTEDENRERVERAVAAQFAHERASLIDMSHLPAGFLERVERYYLRSRDRIAARLADAGATREMADDWIAQSQSEILELTSHVAPGELSARMVDLCDSWAAVRVPELVNLICGAKTDERALSLR